MARAAAFTPTYTPTARRLAAAGLIGLMTLLWTVVEGLPALLEQELSLYQVVWMRYAAHLLCMLLLVAPRIGWGLVRTERAALQVGRGLLMLAMPICFIVALELLPLRNLLALFWVAPLLMLLIAWGGRQERPAVMLWLATGAGCAGALLILRPTAELPAAGALWALGMAASFALYVVLTRTLRHEPTHTNLFYTATCVFLPLSALMPFVWRMPTARDLLIMAGVGIAGLLLLWALDRACELAPVSLLAPFFALQLVVSVVFESLGAGALPGRRAAAGVILVLGAALFGWIAGGRAAPVPTHTDRIDQQVAL